MRRCEIVFIDDGNKISFNAANDGFNLLEIAGLLELQKEDIIQQLRNPSNNKKGGTKKNRKENKNV